MRGETAVIETLNSPPTNHRRFLRVQIKIRQNSNRGGWGGLGGLGSLEDLCLTRYWPTVGEKGKAATIWGFYLYSESFEDFSSYMYV